MPGKATQWVCRLHEGWEYGCKKQIINFGVYIRAIPEPIHPDTHVPTSLHAAYASAKRAHRKVISFEPRCVTNVPSNLDRDPNPDPDPDPDVRFLLFR